jgi:MYXO-CTERM domain-containing protein
LCIGGQCMKATDCGGDGGCGCGVTGHELPLWMGLCALVLLIIRRRRR